MEECGFVNVTLLDLVCIEISELWREWEVDLALLATEKEISIGRIDDPQKLKEEIPPFPCNEDFLGFLDS